MSRMPFSFAKQVESDTRRYKLRSNATTMEIRRSITKDAHERIFELAQKMLVQLRTTRHTSIEISLGEEFADDTADSQLEYFERNACKDFLRYLQKLGILDRVQFVWKKHGSRKVDDLDAPYNMEYAKIEGDFTKLRSNLRKTIKSGKRGLLSPQYKKGVLMYRGIHFKFTARSRRKIFDRLWQFRQRRIGSRITQTGKFVQISELLSLIPKGRVSDRKKALSQVKRDMNEEFSEKHLPVKIDGDLFRGYQLVVFDF